MAAPKIYFSKVHHRLAGGHDQLRGIDKFPEVRLGSTDGEATCNQKRSNWHGYNMTTEYTGIPCACI